MWHFLTIFNTNQLLIGSNKVIYQHMWKHHYQFLTLLFHDCGQTRPLTWWYWKFPLKSTQETQLKSLIALSKRIQCTAKTLSLVFNTWGQKHSKIFIKVRPDAKKFFFFQISELYDKQLMTLWNIHVQVNYMAYIKKLISINLYFFLLYLKQFVICKKRMVRAFIVIKL